MFSKFQMRFYYDKEHDDQNNVENIAIRCSNCEKETSLFMRNMDTNYKYITTSFMLNTVLHHVDIYGKYKQTNIWNIIWTRIIQIG